MGFVSMVQLKEAELTVIYDAPLLKYQISSHRHARLDII